MTKKERLRTKGGASGCSEWLVAKSGHDLVVLISMIHRRRGWSMCCRLLKAHGDDVLSSWWISGKELETGSGKVGACSYFDDPIGCQSLLLRAVHKAFSLTSTRACRSSGQVVFSGILGSQVRSGIEPRCLRRQFVDVVGSMWHIAQSNDSEQRADTGKRWYRRQ
ncbi:hypothetical protein Droror1_Dr00000461 [Drosera rotundifolia]